MPLHTHDCMPIVMSHEIPLAERDKVLLLWIGGGFWTPSYKTGVSNNHDKARLAHFLNTRLSDQFFVSEISEGQIENLHIFLTTRHAVQLCANYLGREPWLRGSIPLPLNTEPPVDPRLVNAYHSNRPLSQVMHIAAASITEFGGGNTREQISGFLNKVTRAKWELVA